MLRGQHGVDATWVPDAYDPHRAQPTGHRVDRTAFAGAAHADRARGSFRTSPTGLARPCLGRDFLHHPADRLRTRGWKRASVTRFYDVGTEVEVWTDVDHLAELCESSRKDRVLSDGLREKGRAPTVAEHTFDHRITEVDAQWR